MSEQRDPVYEAERRIGQALVAFGQGSGIVRVSRGAVDAFRGRYLRPFAHKIHQDWREGHDTWSVEGPNVLDRVRAFGRVAAHLALEEGSMVVDSRHVVAAAERIEGYHLGQWCQIPGEQKERKPREDNVH